MERRSYFPEIAPTKVGKSPPLRSGNSGRCCAFSAEDLVALPKTKLYERARRERIPGRSGMTKSELVEALCHHE